MGDPAGTEAPTLDGGCDRGPGHCPHAHIFVGSKPQWPEIADDLTRYEELPD